MLVSFPIEALVILVPGAQARIPMKLEHNIGVAASEPPIFGKPRVSDFVTFAHRCDSLCECDPLCKEQSKRVEHQMDEAKKLSIDAVLNITIETPEQEDRQVAWSGRVCICSCENGKYWSLACRDLKLELDASRVTAWVVGGKPRYRSPEGEGWTPHPQIHDDCLASFSLLSKLLYNALFTRYEVGKAGLMDIRRDTNPSGLLLFTGETSSGKSQLLQSVIHAYLDDKPVGNHRGHLITLERPILDAIEENDKATDENPKPNEFPITSLLRGLEVTRRQQGTDFDTIEHALEDALRQKPNLVYIDEVRAPDEWRHILRFATTGHLVATTAHAANVPIALSKIMREMQAVTPAQRGEIGRALFGLVHIRADEVQTNECSLKVKIPALWRRTEMGISALISPGLDSLVPTMSTAPGETVKNPAYLGRSYFAQLIADADEARDRNLQEIVHRAQEWDLTEL